MVILAYFVGAYFILLTLLIIGLFQECRQLFGFLASATVAGQPTLPAIDVAIAD
tara:strand:- start:1062 stop:1223 length:162 start_codon:yes stop_codon:yes gene_type:complete